MNKLFSKFWRRLKKVREKSAHRYSTVRFIDALPDVPAQIGNDIYIIGSPHAAKWVVFNCPCSKGHRLTVNLMKSNHPRWILRLSGKKASLSPSIVVTDHPCKSHFWLKSNEAYMAVFED